MSLFKKKVIIFSYLLLTIYNTAYSQNLDNGTPFRIDSHIHLYDTNREGSFVFLNSVEHKIKNHPHLVPEFLEVASPTGVNYAVVVEASKRREDNYWAMDVVNKSDNMLAFIGNLDPRDAHYIQDLDSLSKNKKFRGFRIRPSTNIDISDEKVIDLLGELAKRNLVLELQENKGPIEAIEAISKKYPDMNIIIDHMAGGKIQNGLIVPESWNQRLERLAALPNVYVKISMLYRLSGESPAPTDYRFYELYIDQVLDVFGPNRIIFGSNWTLSELRGSYENLINICDQYLASKKGVTPEQFYFDNAIKAFGLEIK